MASPFAVYCLAPPVNDDCPYGYCPNPDISGWLVRISNYVTGFCISILIFYSPDRVTTAFWSQALMTYSLLISCVISLIRGDLTRFHAIIVVFIVCSPVNVYFTGYSIRAFWSTTHRLDAVLGKTHYVRRALVFFSVVSWIPILVDIYLPHSFTMFSQESCRGQSYAERWFLGTPLILGFTLAADGPGGVWVLLMFLAIPILVAIAWIVAIGLKRREIWPPGQPHKPRFGKVWRTVVSNYPFLRFWSLVAIPTAYWIGVIELGVLPQHEDTFSLTFGQVFSALAAVPSVFQVLYSAPDLWRWFINLTWIRIITRRQAPKPLRPEQTTLLRYTA